tara:strand:+ start:253 stop:513 length:261 start_codon:yes stop_codon:yes gene_type:complete
MKNIFINKIRNQLDESSVELFYKVILAHATDNYDDQLINTMNDNNITIEDHHDEIYGKGTLLEIEDKAYRIYEDRLSVEEFLYIEK